MNRLETLLQGHQRWPNLGGVKKANNNNNKTKDNNEVDDDGWAIIMGNVATGWKPGRIPDSKYYVPPEVYNETYFPPFVTGPSYVVSRYSKDRYY